MEPGRELDALVAEKVMGWTNVNNRGLGIRNDWPQAVQDVIPGYSTNMNAAWRVIEVLEQREWYARVGHYQLKPVQWNCRLVPATATEAYVFADAPTAPHAICLAALKAVGIEV